MKWKTIILEKMGQILKITMNRPEKRNALNYQMINELGKALAEAEQDKDINVVVLAGAGSSFCTGHDVGKEGGKEIMRHESNLENTFESERKMYFSNLMRIRDMQKPVIARLHGNVMAAGVELANACDILIAAEDTLFWEPLQPINHFAAEWVIEPWVMGFRRAKFFFMTGEKMTAQEAARIGMVNLVVPLKNLEKCTMEVANKIASAPTLSTRFCKKVLNQMEDNMGLRNSLEYAFLAHIFIHGTEAFAKSWDEIGQQLIKEGLRPAHTNAAAIAEKMSINKKERL